jgi:hypothetical protein
MALHDKCLIDPHLRGGSYSRPATDRPAVIDFLRRTARVWRSRSADELLAAVETVLSADAEEASRRAATFGKA